MTAFFLYIFGVNYFIFTILFGKGKTEGLFSMAPLGYKKNHLKMSMVIL